MRNLRKSVFLATGLVLLLAVTSFISKDKGTTIPKKALVRINKAIESSAEIKYTAKEQREIDYFNNQATLAEVSRILGENFMLESTVSEMIKEYSNLDFEMQNAVKYNLEKGLLFLSESYGGHNSTGFAPYKEKAVKLGLYKKD